MLSWVQSSQQFNVKLSSILYYHTINQDIQQSVFIVKLFNAGEFNMIESIRHTLLYLSSHSVHALDMEWLLIIKHNYLFTVCFYC
jgi:hypothetical protein